MINNLVKNREKRQNLQYEKYTAHITNNENNTFCMNGDRHKDHNQQGNSNVGNIPNKNTTAHQGNHLDENRITSTYSNAVRYNSKNIVLPTTSILKTLHIGELNRYVKSEKVNLKSCK